MGLRAARQGVAAIQEGMQGAPRARPPPGQRSNEYGFRGCARRRWLDQTHADGWPCWFSASAITIISRDDVGVSAADVLLPRAAGANVQVASNDRTNCPPGRYGDMLGRIQHTCKSAGRWRQLGWRAGLALSPSSRYGQNRQNQQQHQGNRIRGHRTGSVRSPHKMAALYRFPAQRARAYFMLHGANFV